MANGQQINSGQGTVVYEEATAATVTGSAATAAAGTEVPSTSIRLRSRKVGGGAASFLLTGQFSTVQQEAPVKQVSALLSGNAPTLSQGAFTKSSTRALTGTLVQGLQQAIGPQTGAWSVGTLTFTQGANGTQNVFSTGPASYTTGGIYGVDAAGTQLPSGLSLSTDGILTDSGAAVATTTGVLFDYAEPGAYPTLTLHNSSVTDTLPYMGTWYPTEGVVPSGYNVVSPDDSNLRGSILSTWPDGSAQVIVLAGSSTFATTNTTSTIRLRVGQPTGASLTTANIVAAVQTVSVNFTGTPQTLTLTTVNHDRIWWQNPEVICARYRLACGLGVMEAVIDVHAFDGGRAFVEVVIENSRMSSSAPVKPAAQTYSGATVSVNGVNIASGVNSSHTYFPGGVSSTQPDHEAFRAWYCSGWVGGDPGIEVTHDTASMQSHPLLFKITTAPSVDLQATYQSDVYEPWSTERQRAWSMGAGGDHSSIGPLTMWDSRYLQSGDKYARRAVIANALAVLSYNVNYRDSSTNLVPSQADIGSKSRQASTWPSTSTEPSWEVAHHPAEGLIAFLCRPSPCLLEIAQKHVIWFLSAYANGEFNDFYQTRGRAWALRSTTHAAFLTPTSVDASVTAWRTSAITVLTNALNDKLEPYRTSGINPLGYVWEGNATTPRCNDMRGGVTVGFQQSLWEFHWLAVQASRLADAKILSGAAQTTATTWANWALLQPVRYINEATAGEWRYHRYMTTAGQKDWNSGNGGVLWGGNTYSGTYIDQLPTWNQMHAWYMTDGPPAASGPWCITGKGTPTPTSYTLGTVVENEFVSEATAGATGYVYVECYWQALATAVERGVTGAETAWATINANITPSLTSWVNGFADDPRNGAYPRNK